MTSSAPLVLVTDRFAPEALARLQADTRVRIERSASHEPTDEELAKAEGLIIRSRTKIDANLLRRAPALRFVVTATSGFDHIDFAACSDRGLTLTHTPLANAQSAAELTWALVLACARRIPEAHRAVKNGDWRRDALTGIQLSGRTYGIVGLGRIGSRVSRMANAFGMNVLAYDPYLDTNDFEARGAARTGLYELFAQSDVVSLHVPASVETRGMIHRSLLDQSEPGLILVNTSRGQAVQEEALVAALQDGRVRAAGLDVFEKEPLKRDSHLMGLTNVVLSPHLGATTVEAFAQASMEAAEKTLRFFTSGKIDDPLPPRDEWYVNPSARPPADT